MPAWERKLAERRERRERDRSDALARGFQKQRHLGLAETVDGLHRVAHDEERAAVALFPARGELREQLVLRHGGVLELVDEDVVDAVVEREHEIRGAVLGLEGAKRALGDLDEIGLPVRGEADLELTHGHSATRTRAPSASHWRSVYPAGGRPCSARIASSISPLPASSFASGGPLRHSPFVVRREFANAIQSVDADGARAPGSGLARRGEKAGGVVHASRRISASVASRAARWSAARR